MTDKEYRKFVRPLRLTRSQLKSVKAAFIIGERFKNNLVLQERFRKDDSNVTE